MVSAQGLVNFNYQVTYPSGETNDYIDKISFRGVGMEWRKYIQDDISAGISLNWNVFHKVETKIEQLEDGAVTGTQNRTINSFPFMVTAHYYLGGRRDIRPYGGLGLGAFLIEKKLDIGIYSLSESNWHFGVSPELGVQFPVGYDTTIMVALKYNYAFETKEEQNSYFGLSVGFATDVF
jgi:outer membrane protein W